MSLHRAAAGKIAPQQSRQVQQTAQQPVSKNHDQPQNHNQCNSKAGPHFQLIAKPFQLQHARLRCQPAGKGTSNKNKQNQPDKANEHH